MLLNHLKRKMVEQGFDPQAPEYARVLAKFEPSRQTSVFLDLAIRAVELLARHERRAPVALTFDKDLIAVLGTSAIKRSQVPWTMAMAEECAKQLHPRKRPSSETLPLLIDAARKKPPN